ncbi:hypothetical protein NPIL_100981 [Nephila pilipes]|uniref:Uncharacterized protein n=1 Tax=Nephila pilipes TaxID=299642 RepID=A0A8X6TH14_NEPPI|nr:hypothetical protein NPIL_100981 [Nephila pilipes]
MVVGVKRCHPTTGGIRPQSQPSQKVSTTVATEVSKFSESKGCEPLKKLSPVAAPGIREIFETNVNDPVSSLLETTPHVHRKEVSSELLEITRRKVRRPPKVSSPLSGPRVILKVVWPQM